MMLANPRVRGFCASIVSLLFLISTSAAQTAKPRPTENLLSKVLKDNPGLLKAWGEVLEKWKQGVQFPAVRYQSNLLPLVSPSTTYYVAIPNYGEAAEQALTIFRAELQQNAALRNWWQQGQMAKNGPQFIRSVETFSQISQYLGEEIMISGGTEAAGNPVMIAAVRKPGLKNFLEQTLKSLPEQSKANVRVLDLQELATAKMSIKASDLVVLVRPDFVIASPGLESLRAFNSRLEGKKGEFASTSFGQRLGEAYQKGTSVLAAGDLHKILTQIPPGTPANHDVLERSGFSDMKYLVWDSKKMNNQSFSETELSFMGPRRGAAAWLAAPTRLGSLDFVSPKAPLVLTLGLKNLGEIFEDLKGLAAYSNPKSLETVPQMEQAMHIRLKDDLLSLLQGEITIALKDFTGPSPAWTAILRVNDPDHLQATIAKLLSSAPVQAGEFEEEGVHYHSLVIPSSQKTVQIVYAFLDGYLVIGSSRQSAAEAIGLHRGGESLAKSSTFLASIPPGYSPEASAVLYEDASAIGAMQLQRVSPEMGDALSPISMQPTPITFLAYGENDAIRAVSSGGGADAGIVMAGAAIAIPSLLRARVAANEASAAATIRSVVVAQVSYSGMYPNKGYARDLAALGPDPRGTNVESANHAGMLDAKLANPSCAAGAWCSRSGYRFSLRAVCNQRGCNDFVAVGTPESFSTGRSSFCSTSDGVIRVRADLVLGSPISVAECRSWPAVQ